MKFVKRLIGITLTVSAITIMGITTVKATTVTVTSDTLNIREKASGSSKIIAVLSNGAKCDFIEEDGDWYKIKFGSYTGYISKQYSKKVEIRQILQKKQIILIKQIIQLTTNQMTQKKQTIP